MSLTPWTRQEEWYQEMIDAIGEGGGSGLPPVTASDAGKVLAVDNSGVWGAQEPIGKKFIVTLTPTSPDFSGTMDKTVAEINAAYEAGQEIVFSLDAEIDGFNVTLTSVANETVYLGDYKGFHATFIMESRDVMIRAITTATFDGTNNTYSVSIFELTPAT